MFAVKRLSQIRPARIAPHHLCDMSVSKDQDKSNWCKHWSHYGWSRNKKLELIQSFNQSSEEATIFMTCYNFQKRMTGLDQPLIGGSADLYFIPSKLMAEASILIKMYSQVIHMNIFHKFVSHSALLKNMLV